MDDKIVNQALDALKELVESTRARMEIVGRRQPSNPWSVLVEIFVGSQPIGLGKGPIFAAMFDELGGWQYQPTVEGWREALATLGRFTNDMILRQNLRDLFGEPTLGVACSPCRIEGWNVSIPA